jgi:hypothetical protein
MNKVGASPHQRASEPRTDQRKRVRTDNRQRARTDPRQNFRADHRKRVRTECASSIPGTGDLHVRSPHLILFSPDSRACIVQLPCRRVTASSRRNHDAAHASASVSSTNPGNASAVVFGREPRPAATFRASAAARAPPEAGSPQGRRSQEIVTASSSILLRPDADAGGRYLDSPARRPTDPPADVNSSPSIDFRRTRGSPGRSHPSRSQHEKRSPAPPRTRAMHGCRLPVSARRMCCSRACTATCRDEPRRARPFSRGWSRGADVRTRHEPP